MPLKKSSGNMYPWVTHTHNHLGGECPHHCAYCYVDNPRFGRPARYTGPVRLIEDELRANYGEGKTIFVENMGDLFAAGVSDSFIGAVLTHCKAYPANTYVFQTKNPGRLCDWLISIPRNSIVGTTMESNRFLSGIMRAAPPPRERAAAIMLLRLDRPDIKTFITIEPVLRFDVDRFAQYLFAADPSFINIGADSKNHGLPEPTAAEVAELIRRLKVGGIEIREKHNLDRLRSETSSDPAAYPLERGERG